MNKESSFEKLFLFLTDPNYEYANIAIANCPDNWSYCSLVAHGVFSNGRQSFIHLGLTKEETIKIRDALSQVIRDMEKIDET